MPTRRDVNTSNDRVTRNQSIHIMSSFRIILFLLTVLLTGGLQAQGTSDEVRRRKLSYYFMAAQRAKDQDRYADMMELLKHCQEIMPDDPATMFELGQYNVALGMDSLGLAMIEQAVAADPGNPWYLERLATTYLSRGDRDQALEVLEKMASLQSKRVDVLSQLFVMYKQLGRTEDVINTLDRIQTLQGNSLRIAEQKYQLYQEMEEPEKAFGELRAICREFPYDVSSHLVLGEHYMENGMLDSAVVCMERAERLDPHNSGLQLMRLRSVLEQGDTLAYERQRDSLILNPQADPQVRFISMREVALEALQDSLKLDHTSRIFDQLLADEKVDVEFLQLYKSYDAYLHQEDEDYSNLDILKRIVKADPSVFESQIELAQYYIDHNEGANLREVCQEALVYFPSETRFHYFLAITYLQDDMNQEAEETLKAGIRQADEDESSDRIKGLLYSMLGDLCHEMHREKEAFAAYDSCLVYTPDEVSCLNNYAYYLSLKGERLEQAEQMSYQAVKLQPDNKTYLDTYAWVLFVQEDYTTARIYMDKVVNPQLEDSVLLKDAEVNAVLLEHAGDIYANCGQMDVALRLWQLAQDKVKNDGQTASVVLKKKLKKKKYLKK